MGLGGSSGGSEALALQQKQQGQIDLGLQHLDNIFSGFDSGFYNKRAQDYSDFALPKLNQQFQTQQKGLDYNLADSGLGKSKAASNMQASLQQALAEQKQGVVDTGIQQSQALAKDIGQERQLLTGQLEASANPTAVSQQALTAAGQFSAPSVFAPVGNFFSNWAGLYGAKASANSLGGLNNPGALSNIFGLASRGGGAAPVPGTSYTN